MIVVAPGYEHLRKEVEQLPLLFEQRQGKLVRESRNTVRIFEWCGERYVVKSFGRAPLFLNRFIYGFLRKSKAQRSFENAQRLLRMGIGSPAPVAWRDDRQGMTLRRSYYVCRLSDCDRDIWPLFCNAYEGDDTPIIQEVARVTARLHTAGVIHQDYSAGNILFRQTDDGKVMVELIDLNRMRFLPYVSKSMAIKNISKQLFFNERQATVFAAEYARERGQDEAKWAEALKNTCHTLE